MRKLIKDNFLFIALPFLLSLISAIIVRNCSFFYGTLFYIVLTVPSFVVGSALGLICYFIMPRFPKLLFGVIFLIVLILPAIEIYFNPQIYFFNPLIGYYPGTIYDESLKMSTNIVLYRMLNLIFFSAAAAFIIRSIAHKKHFSNTFVIIVAGSLILISSIFSILKSPLGFATSEGKMKSVLSGNLETEHFSIYFDKRISRKIIENLALRHEYYYQEVVHYLNAEPKSKLTSFLFYDAQQKKELLGSAAADVAMPWKYQLFINYENHDETLRHEIAHCITADFGITPFRLSAGFNPSLLEGIAAAADNRYGTHTVHYMAALAYNNGYRVPIETIFSGFNFFGQTSTLSYMYSGSFIRFMIERYGIERFKKIYQGGNYNEVYNKSLNDLAKEYYYYIGSLSLALNRVDEANYYYGRPTIFKKVCARYVATKTDDGWNSFRQGNYYESKDVFEDLFNYSHSYQALLGYVYSLKKLENSSIALDVLDQNIENFHNSAYFYDLQLLKGDLSVENKEYYAAGNAYREIQRQNPSKDYYCLSSLRERIINDTSLISKYINGSEYDKYTLLKKLNSDSVFTASVPAMITLSEKLNENYHDFINYFKNRLSSYSLISSYSALKLSKFALKENDLQNARIFALTALNYKDDKDFTEILNQNLKTIEWFMYSSDLVRFNFKWNSF
ncbi:MAG: hypothetical protein ACM34K_03050 [Bacillota bacterium]